MRTNRRCNVNIRFYWKSWLTTSINEMVSKNSCHIFCADSELQYFTNTISNSACPEVRSNLNCISDIRLRYWFNRFTFLRNFTLNCCILQISILRHPPALNSHSNPLNRVQCTIFSGFSVCIHNIFIQKVIFIINIFFRAVNYASLGNVHKLHIETCLVVKSLPMLEFSMETKPNEENILW